jgi:hypothetical protein
MRTGELKLSQDLLTIVITNMIKGLLVETMDQEWSLKTELLLKLADRFREKKSHPNLALVQW